MQSGQVVLVDTNIIIEAVRTNCWTAITAHFIIETVDKCCEEARTGRAHRPGYVEIDEAALRTRLTVRRITETEMAALGLRDAEIFHLDPGELELWAHALSRTDAWPHVLVTAMRSRPQFGWVGKTAWSRLKNSRVRWAHESL